MSDDGPLTVQLLVDIEDRLFPTLNLDVWERCLYYYLLRHTRLLGVSSVSIGMAAIGKGSGMSEVKARETLRSMDKKGCVSIEDRNRKGHVVRVLLPSEIDRVRELPIAEAAVDIEQIDFYTDRRYLGVILRRDNSECFYCKRAVTSESVVLDHVVAAMEKGNNSHRNIVACCHECNSLKQGAPVEDFLRSLYRRAVLSQDDLTVAIARIAKLQAGQLAIVLDAPE